MREQYKIVYMGTPHYAQVILEGLIEAEDMAVVLVLTQPDRPVGRKRVLTPPAVKVVAMEAGIEVLQPERLSEAGIAEAIEAVEPDFIIVAAFGQLLPKRILDIAPCINLHASLLPQYRGASPLQQSLLNGDTQTGVTSMLMEEGLDTGDILQRRVFDIPPTMRLHALMAQLTEDAKVLTLQTIREYPQITPEPQNDAEATLCKKIKKSDGEIDFVDAQAIYRKYRAFEGWPAIFAVGGMKLDGVRVEETTTPHTPATIVAFEGESVIVGCQQGSLRIDRLQPPSKKPMSAKAYCVGRGLQIGDSLL